MTELPGQEMIRGGHFRMKYLTPTTEVEIRLPSLRVLKTASIPLFNPYPNRVRSAQTMESPEKIEVIGQFLAMHS